MKFIIVAVGYKISATDILKKSSYSILYNSLSKKISNWFALEHFNISVRGPIIIIKNNQSNFDYDEFIKMFPKKISTTKCKNCNENIINSFDFIIEQGRLCNSCYYI